MKSVNLLIAFVAAATLAAAASNAHAGYIFNYNFDDPDISASAAINPQGADLNNYSQSQGVPGGSAGGGVILAGQDGWADVSGVTWSPLRVFTNGPGNSGNTVHEYNANQLATKGAQHYFYTNQSWKTFTAADTAVDLLFRVYAGGTGTNSSSSTALGLNWDGYGAVTGRGGLQWSGYVWQGASTVQRTMNFIPFNGATTTYGAQLTFGHWYDFKAVMDFSPIANDQSPTISYFYRDLGTTLDGSTPLPTDPTGYVAEAAIQNMAMWVGTLPTEYKANAMYLRTDRSSYQVAIDSVGVYQIPEPSTLALLAAGLVGLLAYVWRKRK